MHTSNVLTAILLATSISVAVGGCGGQRGPAVTGTGSNADPVGLRPLGEATEASFVESPLHFCRQKALELKPTSVQILVDASGSMVGYRATQPRLAQWTKQAVSHLNGEMLELRGFRLAQFNEQGGIFAATRWTDSPAPVQASSNTNLHEAVATAPDYELTLIITDGVAATGVGGSGECPGGVDAACVASTLRNFVHSAGASTERSVHLVPLVAPYDGRFYTEELLSPSAFDAGETAEAVEGELGAPVQVVNPQADASGRLAFNYVGPRALLIVVLARDPFVGRAAVDALVRTAASNGVARARQLADAGSGVALLAPVEIYPGFVEPVRWTRLTEVDDPNLREGTMEAGLTRHGGDAVLNIGCFGSERASSDVVLKGEGGNASSGCLELDLLPAVRFELTAGSGSAVRDAVEGYGFNAANNSDSLYMRLTCPAEFPQAGGQAYWKAHLEYAPASQCLTDSGCDSAPHARLRQLSTVHPSREPHRIFNLDQLIAVFYNQVADDSRSVSLASMRFRSAQ